MDTKESSISSIASGNELEQFCAALLKEQGQLRQTCAELQKTCGALATTCGSLLAEISRHRLENRQLKEDLQAAHGQALATVNTRLAEVERVGQSLQNSSARLSSSLTKLSTVMSRR